MWEGITQPDSWSHNQQRILKILNIWRHWVIQTMVTESYWRDKKPWGPELVLTGGTRRQRPSERHAGMCDWLDRVAHGREKTKSVEYFIHFYLIVCTWWKEFRGRVWLWDRIAGGREMKGEILAYNFRCFIVLVKVWNLHLQDPKSSGSLTISTSHYSGSTQEFPQNLGSPFCPSDSFHPFVMDWLDCVCFTSACV